MNWSPQQETAIREVNRWLNDRTSQVFYLGGYAGTGKTTLAQHLVQDVKGLVLFAAFTGKAASVLRQRGCSNANTLHSILYDVVDRDKTKLIDMQKKLFDENLSAHEKSELQREVDAEIRRLTKPRFSLSEESILADAELLVLDECSMVNRQLGEDALSFGKKILVLGDPAQLPPVMGSGYFTSRKPDFLLTEIHRQAQDNPIIQLATTVRNGGVIPYGQFGTSAKMRKERFNEQELIDPTTQVLTGKNETRRALNKKIRDMLGYKSRWPVKGDKLVCLRNDKDYGILNGVLCKAIHNGFLNRHKELILHIEYEDKIFPDAPCQPSQFLAYEDPTRENDVVDRNLIQLDYGYALTVHKSQGSQWEKVIIWDDGFQKRDNNMRKKWLYTAITRAQERVVLVG